MNPMKAIESKINFIERGVHAKIERREITVGESLLNGKVYDTRNLRYSKIIEKIQDIEQKTPAQNNYIKMKCLLDKGTELRNRYTGESLDKIPFDLFVENKNDTYFVEVKTKIKSDNNIFNYNDTEAIGWVAANQCKILAFIILLYAQDTNLEEFIPEFELLKIARYRLPISFNKEYNKRKLQSSNFFGFEFDSCDKETCKKVIRQDFLDLIL